MYIDWFGKFGMPLFIIGMLALFALPGIIACSIPVLGIDSWYTGLGISILFWIYAITRG